METREGSPPRGQTQRTGTLPRGHCGDYEALIRRVVQTPTAEVFVYRWDENTYPTVVTVDVQHPEVSGAEHLEMLQIRAGRSSSLWAPNR